MLKKILGGLVLIVVVFSIVVALQPSDYRVQRLTTIAAPASVVFAQVNDFHNWDSWSPWAKLDPNAKNSFEGSASGVGAILRWDGNHEVGKGSMTLIESRPDSLIRIQLDFLEPFEGTSIGEFLFEEHDAQTVVTWSMSGQNNFIGKAIGLFMDCDTMIGRQFEKGLAQLKVVAER